MIDRLDKKLVYWSGRTIIEVSLRLLQVPGVSHMGNQFFSHSGIRLTRKNPLRKSDIYEMDSFLHELLRA
jgi:hypothetical protein